MELEPVKRQLCYIEDGEDHERLDGVEKEHYRHTRRFRGVVLRRDNDLSDMLRASYLYICVAQASLNNKGDLSCRSSSGEAFFAVRILEA